MPFRRSLFDERSVSLGCGPREQVDILFIELLFVQILLDLDEGFAHAGLIAGSPGERVSVRSAMVDDHIDVELLPLGDNAGIEPGNGGELVPKIIGLGIFRDILGGGRGTFGDLLDEAFSPYAS